MRFISLVTLVLASLTASAIPFPSTGHAVQLHHDQFPGLTEAETTGEAARRATDGLGARGMLAADTRLPDPNAISKGAVVNPRNIAGVRREGEEKPKLDLGKILAALGGKKKE